MNKTFFYFCVSLFSVIIIIQLFIFAVDNKDDESYEKEFNIKYGIFAIVKPDFLSFSGEEIPIQSSEIWERLDRELLKNIYWQSSTMLFFKKANKYFPIIEPILKENNIPDDFKYLAVIESGLENVVSPAGAAGFWQILKGTAREYGLEVNNEIDERYNLEKSTQAACLYLKDAYKMFGNWTLAAASYNMGKAGLRSRMSSQGATNYYNLHLNSETSRYLFRIIAVKEILTNPLKYGFVFRSKDLYVMPEYRVLEIDSTIASLSDFARVNSVNYKLIKYFNPWLRSYYLPDESRKKYFLKIPIDSDLVIPEDTKNSTESLN